LIKTKFSSPLTSKEIEGMAVCKDEVCLTTFNDLTHTKRTYEMMKKDNKAVTLEGNVIVEYRRGEKKEEIAEKIISDLKKLKRQFPFIKIKYKVVK